MYRLSLTEENLHINFIYRFVIFLSLTVISNPFFLQMKLLYWFSVGLVVISLLWLFINSKFWINNYLIWIFLFIIIVLSSNMWAMDKYFASEGINRLVITFLVFSLISVVIKSEIAFYQVLKIFLYSQLITALTIILSIDFKTIGMVRIGADTLGEGWNANNIGMSMAIVSFIALNLIYKEKKLLIKLIYLIFILLFGYITVMTGSRKAFFVLAFSSSMLYILRSKNKIFLKTIIVVLVALVLYYIVMNNQYLYGVLGSRIDTLIGQFTGQSIADKSSIERLTMISYGLKLFQENPFWGYGINNFREAFGNATGYYMYAHNNYIELLVDIGIIGFIIYYSGYLYIFINSFNKKNSLLVFSFISIVTILITELGLVSYNVFYIQFLICMSFSAIYLVKKEAKK